MDQPYDRGHLLVYVFLAALQLVVNQLVVRSA
jgi:hypothetical protein